MISEWGTDIILILCQTLILPRLDYGSIIIWFCKEQHILLLDTIHYQGLSDFICFPYTYTFSPGSDPLRWG